MPQRWGIGDGSRLIGGAGEPSAQILEAQPGEVWAPPSDAHIVSITPNGAPFYRRWVDGKEIHAGAAPAGTVNFIPVGAAPRAFFSQPFRIFHIYIPAGFAARQGKAKLRRSSGSFCPDNPFVFSDPALHSLGCLLEIAVHERSRFSRLYVDSLMLAITARLLVICSGSMTSPQPQKGGLAPWQVKRVCERMAEDLAAEPSLGELAGLLGFSPEHFCRAFRRSTGMPPHRWLAMRRMDEARSLLLSSDLALDEIARRVGYSRQSAFGAAFTRATGRPPAAWRLQQRS